MSHVTVLIAGAGPVGLTMANELARYGISVRIVDPAAARTDKSKALVLWSRTLELFDHGGYVDPFLAAFCAAVKEQAERKMQAGGVDPAAIRGRLAAATGRESGPIAT